MSKLSKNIHVGKWMDVDYDYVSDDETDYQFNKNIYSNQILRQCNFINTFSLYIIHIALTLSSQMFTRMSYSTLYSSEFNQRIDILCGQFPEVPVTTPKSTGDWYYDANEFLETNDYVIQLFHDFCFGDNYNVLASSKVLEQLRRVISTMTNPEITFYLSTMLNNKIMGEINYYTRSDQHILDKQQIPLEEVQVVADVYIGTHYMYLEGELECNSKYKIETTLEYKGSKNSITVNIKHIPLCKSEYTQDFNIIPEPNTIVLKKGKQVKMPLFIEVKRPNMSIQEIISIEINQRSRLFCLCSVSTAPAVFGVYPEYLPCSIDHDSNVYIPNALQYIKKKLISTNAYHTNRIFRESCSKEEKEEAIHLLNNGNELHFQNPSLYANLLLNYFRSLPRPLLYSVTFQDVVNAKISAMKDYKTQSNIFYNWCSSLPKAHQDIIIFLLDIICQVLMNYKDTQMNIESFCVLLMPNLMDLPMDETYVITLPIMKNILSGVLINRLVNTFNLDFDSLKDMHILP
ncbi:hypothetical protein WA158_006385 [Blastocystis sp. Blastoise]